MTHTLSRSAFFGSALLLASACGVLFPDSDPPQEARIIVDASPQAPLELIVSTDFTSVPQVDGTTSLTFESADTIAVTGNFDERYSLSPSDARVVAILTNPNLSTEPVRLRVLLDGDTKYDASASLTEGTFLQYTYRFDEGTYQDQG